MEWVQFIILASLAGYMSFTFIRDIRAMIKAPKGRKIEAYYTSARGRNPFTGEIGRNLR